MRRRVLQKEEIEREVNADGHGGWLVAVGEGVDLVALAEPLSVEILDVLFQGLEVGREFSGIHLNNY